MLLLGGEVQLVLPLLEAQSNTTWRWSKWTPWVAEASLLMTTLSTLVTPEKLMSNLALYPTVVGAAEMAGRCLPL